MRTHVRRGAQGCAPASQAASDLYARAVKGLEADSKAGAAADIFRHATGNELRAQNWGAAAGFELRWRDSCAPRASCTAPLLQERRRLQ